MKMMIQMLRLFAAEISLEKLERRELFFLLTITTQNRPNAFRRFQTFCFSASSSECETFPPAAASLLIWRLMKAEELQSELRSCCR